MINIWKFSLKVWLTAALVSPLIMLLIEYAENYSKPFYLLENELPYYFIIVIVGIIFSCLPWLLFTGCIIAVYKRCFNPADIRLLVQIAGLSIVLFTFIAVFAVHDQGLLFLSSWFFWSISAPYLIITLLSISIYQLPQIDITQQEN